MNKLKSSHSLAVLVASGLLAACGTSHPNGPSSPSTAAASGQSPTSPLRPVGGVTTSATIALAKNGAQRLAFAADEDAKAIVTIDVDGKKELAQTPLGGTPGQILVTADGRVLVTVRETSKLVALRFTSASAPLGKAQEVTTAAEPIAMALAPDGALLVTSGWGRRLAAFDLPSLAPRYEVKLPREPRSVVVADDGKTAFVSHAVGSQVSTVDLGVQGNTPWHATSTIAMKGPNPQLAQQLAQFKKLDQQGAKNPFRSPSQDKFISSLEKRAVDGRESCQGFILAKSSAVPNRIFGPQVMVDPGDPEGRAGGYGDGIPEVPAVAVIDEAAKKPLAPSMTSPNPMVTAFARMKLGGGKPAPQECLLPRGAAIDPTTQSLYVTCFGIDSVIEYDANAASPAAARRHEWTVGSGPTGIAIDPEKHQAVVFSQFDRSVTTIALRTSNELVDDKSNEAKPDRITLAPIATMSPQIMLGRMLFHSSGDTRISADGRACASCHPDGRDDAITWSTPDGPRRSIMLAGRVRVTPPYSWEGNAQTIQAHLGSTFRRLRGQGLKPVETDALVAYITSLPAPPQGTAGVDGGSPFKKKLDRGRDIFASAEAACASCHSGSSFTDGVIHDVASSKEADNQKAFNTPSLHLVGGAGPYFHDGRYATLGDLLKQTSGTMGTTSHLSAADMDALQTYVESL